MAEIAIVSFANRPKGQSRAGMRAVMLYAMREEKTCWGDELLVSGLNCTPQTAYDDFLSTKLQHGKDGGRMFYHMVQSFPVDEDVPPKVAHEMAMRLAEYFKDYEVLVCTHVDRDHIHSHLIINSVAMESGKKFHISTPEIEPIRKLNDSLCTEYGFEVFQPKQKKSRSMSIGEKHTAVRGESWKWELISVVNEAMKYAHTREEFIDLMSFEGYQVSWSPTRKSITYICPNGKRCRDLKMHDNKYLKEAMEREFAIRSEHLRRGTNAPQLAEEQSGMYADTGDGQRTGAEPFSAERENGYDTGQADQSSAAAGAGRAEEAAQLDREDAPTGWESARAILFDPTLAQTRSQGQSVDMGVPDYGELVDAAIQLGRSLEYLAAPTFVKDATTMPQVHERKRKRKRALGQKEDDHEDSPGMTMSM